MHVRKTLLILGLIASAVLGQNDLLISPFEKEVPETTLDLRMIEHAAQEVAKTATQCTVAIQAGIAHGSGVIISEDGYVLTAAHVIGEPGREVTIKLPDGRDFKGETLGIHTTADGGLVKIWNPSDLPFVPLVPEGEAPKPGDWCLATGHPNGFMSERQPPVRLGRIIDVLPNVLRTECTITGGDSGGPLFDLEGRVIGIHSRIGEGFTENYHVPAASFREAWTQLVEGKTYPHRSSAFLSMLDKDHDGKLTRGELQDDVERAVFDRLAENFELKSDEPLVIDEIAKDKFKWRASPRLMLSRLTFPRELFATSLPERDYMRGQRIQALLRPSTTDVAKSTARITSGRRRALGIVVDKEGLLITKASHLGTDAMICQFNDGRKLEATLVAKDPAYDIALLRVSASDLIPAVWNEAPLTVGSWLFTPNAHGEVVTTGVLSVPSRNIERVPPVIGIQVKEGSDEPRVVVVFERSGAEKAGMKAGDLITHVNEDFIETFVRLKETLATFQAGDRVDITVARAGESIKLDVMLGARGDVFLGFDDFRRMSGDLSKLRDGFPAAFQSDAIVPPDICGGPVIDVSGKVVGVNIARSDRVAALCIPYHELKPLIEKLKSEE